MSGSVLISARGGLAGVCLGALMLASVAGAQPPQDAPAPMMEELISRGYGGPPWWRVSDKDTTIFVLASPTTLPAGTRFDTELLERRLTGAHSLIVFNGNGGSPSLSGRSAIDRIAKDLNTNTKTILEPSLPPALRVRFTALREKAGQPETRYGALPPGLAGVALAGDIAWAENSRAEAVARPQSVEQIAAEKARAKRVRPTVVSARPFAFTDLRKLGPGCLAGMLDNIEAPGPINPPTPVDEAAETVRAWADGDVRPLLRMMEGPQAMTGGFSLNLTNRKGSIHLFMNHEACFRDSPSMVRIKQAIIPDLTTAMRQALRKPGHGVALIPAPPLLVRGGVLDTLKREGFTVTTPGQTP